MRNLASINPDRLTCLLNPLLWSQSPDRTAVSPVHHFCTSSLKGLSAANSPQERGRRRGACYFEERVSTDKTPERPTQPSWDLVLGTENHPGNVFFPWRLWEKCSLYFLSGASGFRLSTCPKTLSLIKAGASSKILGRISFRSQCNFHLTHGS